MIRSDLKRISIISVYVAIIFAAWFLIHSWLSPHPSCFDNIQNQNEEGMDCGGVCLKKCENIPQEKLAVISAGMVNSGVANKYDLYAQINNVNQAFGSDNFEYKFIARDQAGSEITSLSGINFILPGETKYIIESSVAFSQIPASIEMIVGSTNWIEKNDLYQGPELRITNKEYNIITSGIEYAEAKGLVTNDSALDYNLINIRVILKDTTGKIIAINSTEMRTVKSSEGRDFRVFWPNKFDGDVASMEVQADVNVFSSNAFSQQFFKHQNFQD